MSQNPLTCVRVAPDQVLLQGDLNFHTVTQGLAQGALFLTGHERMIFNLKDIQHCDSSALALLLEWMRLARQQGIQLKFVNLPDKMVDLGRVSCLDGILPLG